LTSTSSTKSENLRFSEPFPYQKTYGFPNLSLIRKPTDRGTTCQALRPAPLLRTPPYRGTTCQALRFPCKGGTIRGGLRGALVAPLQFNAGFHVSVRLQRALDAPPKFRKHNVQFLRFTVFYVVLDLQLERLYGGEFGRMQLQFGQLFQDRFYLRLTLCLRSIG